MTTLQKFAFLALAICLAIGLWAFTPAANAPSLKGAWLLVSEDASTEQTTWVFSDDYNSYTTFDIEKKQFVGTRGGKYSSTGNAFSEMREFDTWDSEKVGIEDLCECTWNDAMDEVSITCGKDNKQTAQTWKRIDDGSADLAGAWQITQRMREGEMQEIMRRGTRKTVKLLSSTRFQWIAIDPGKSAFYGTGGGTYTFEDGVYTEHIEFFSRDSSRVGMSLSFEGKVTDDDWHHSGKSSKGKPISEVWSR
ncbi:MAG: hypothetical protein AAF927_05775 [Bacteroidota bacterium]